MGIIRRFILLVSLTFALICLSGCSAKPEAHFSLQAARYLNPSIYGHPSPVVVNFYQLSNPYAFIHANYYKLAGNAGAILSNTLIDRETLVMRPGKNQAITLSLSSNTKYIGITAAYRNIDHAIWKKIIKVPPKKHRVAFLLNLESEGISLQHSNNVLFL